MYNNVPIVTMFSFMYLVLPPTIAESPRDVITPLSSTATFKCIGQGYGYVRIIWEKRNTDNPLPTKTNIDTYTFNHHIISILIIPSVHYEDEGIYQCVYVNSRGATYSYPARLVVGSKLHLMYCIYIFISFMQCS